MYAEVIQRSLLSAPTASYTKCARFRFAVKLFFLVANRLPGLQSSKQNLEDENKVYDGMMLDLIRLLVLPPLTGCPPDEGLFEVSDKAF